MWNAATIPEEREIEPRANMWASELGKGVADVVLKMRGVKPTNPPNDRSRRKFEAGNIFEWIVRLVLLRAGVLQKTQERIAHKYGDEWVEVTGRLDFVAGGVPRLVEGLAMPELELPTVIARAGDEIIEKLRAAFPDGLKHRIVEVKSLSSFMFDALAKTGSASRNHRLQNFHYIKGRGEESGSILYICRDDLRMMEVEVFNDADTENEYRAEIAEISRVYLRNEQVPLEPLIVYDTDTEKFTRNWNVAYSSYLTMLYGFKTTAEYEDLYRPKATRFNSVLNRIRTANLRAAWLAERNHSEETVQYEKVEGKRVKKQFVEVDGEQVYLPDNIVKGYEMTANNKAAIAEMEELGFNAAELAARIKEPVPVEDEEETE